MCTDRVLRLAAKTEGQRDDWVSAISAHLIRSHVILKGSEMGIARMTKVLKRMGKNSKMARCVKPLMKYYKNLEAECQRDYAVAKVLERVEAAEASGRAVDLEAAQATQEAFWQAQEAMEAINAHIDVGVVMSLCEDLGLRQSEFEHPRAQTAFQQEYHATKNMFKGLTGDDDDDDEDDWHLFPTQQMYEGALGMSQKEDARRQKRVWVAVYQDKMAYWKKKQSKTKGKRPTGYFEMAELMQADNTDHQNFQIVHFDARRSSYFFTANAVETERWLDVISHSMIDYNSKEKEAKAYASKFEVVEESLKALTRTVRSKKKSPPMWTYFMLYLHGYNVELFDRLKEIRSQANAQRVHVTSANPHMMKRRVAAQLDDLVSFVARHSCRVALGLRSFARHPAPDFPRCSTGIDTGSTQGLHCSIADDRRLRSGASGEARPHRGPSRHGKHQEVRSTGILVLTATHFCDCAIVGNRHIRCWTAVPRGHCMGLGRCSAVMSTSVNTWVLVMMTRRETRRRTTTKTNESCFVYGTWCCNTNMDESLSTPNVV
eukprot:COSAG02_NODE_1877_length_10559_cov_8.819025_2_plen_545_part_00